VASAAAKLARIGEPGLSHFAPHGTPDQCTSPGPEKKKVGVLNSKRFGYHPTTLLQGVCSKIDLGDQKLLHIVNIHAVNVDNV